MVNGRVFDESGDPLITAAAFGLVQLLAREGVVAEEIKIRFSSSAEPAPTTVTIQLPSLSEPPGIRPDFEGLNGVYAVLDVDE